MKALEEVTAKVAEAHGFNFKSAVEKPDDDELDAVAGGECDNCIDYSQYDDCGGALVS